MQIPKNVIQTGEPDPCHKIYVEDYVHTLLTQYRENEADFCLYGKLEQEGEITYYFIYGAAKEEPGWELMESRYFALHRRIGEATFDEKEAWAFFEDGYSAPLSGCFIFYEQNEDMQSYLIAMHQNRPGEKAVTFRHRAAERIGAGGTDGRAGAGGPDRTGGQDRADAGAGRPDRTGGQDRADAGAGRPGSTGIGGEPRRILRRPMVYDLKKEKEAAGKPENDGRQERKSLHAAQAFPETGRRNPGDGHGRIAGMRRSDRTEKTWEKEKRTGFRIRAAAAAVLLGLCAAAITSAKEGQETETAGNFITQTLEEWKAEDSGGRKQNAAPDPGALVIEETQISGNESVSPEETAFAEGTASPEEEPEAEASPVSAAEEPAAEASPVSEAEEPAAEISSVPAEEEAAVPEGGEQSLSPAEEAPQAETDPLSPKAETEPVLSSEAAAVPAEETVTYVVRWGDSLAEICRRQYGNADRVKEIAALNQLADPNHLIPGQKIRLPR